MDQNNVEAMYVDDGMSSYKEFRNRVQEYFSNRKITQSDVELLKNKPWQTIKDKQLCTEEFFYWLTKSEVLFSYEILEFFEQQNIHINQLQWTPHFLRLGVSREGIIEKNIFDLLIGGNTVEVDWKYYNSKDYYDPDFQIYNDITIKYCDQDLAFSYEIWNYPEAQFPPVYAHSTIYDKKTNAVYITGGLGSGDRQRKNITEIYQLDLDTKDIQKIEASGESPQCLHDHQVKMWNHDLIELRGGSILRNGKAVQNLYVWYFNLKTKMWLKQDSEKYQHWVVTAVNDGELFLEISKKILYYEEIDPNYIEKYKQDTLKSYQHIPDYQMYSKLYHVNANIYCSKVESSRFWITIYQCILDGQVYQYFEGYNRIEVAFQASASNEFQQFIINDLTSKLKQISGHAIVAEKLS